MWRRVLADVADDYPGTGIARLKFVHDGTRCLMRVGIASSRTAFNEQDVFHIVPFVLLSFFNHLLHHRFDPLVGPIPR